MPHEMEALLHEAADRAPHPSPDLVHRSLQRRGRYLRRRRTHLLLGGGVAAAAVLVAGGVGLLGIIDARSPQTEPPVTVEPDSSDAASFPACPSEAEVTQMKADGIEIPPCDPLPEDEDTSSPAEQPTSEQPGSDGNQTCPAVTTGKLAGLTVALPCAEGAAILDTRLVQVDGEWCARITYIAKTGEDQVTETLCEGDRPSVGGPPVSGPPAP